MGLTCCTQRETSSDYLDQVRRELDAKYISRINIQPLVNMIPETQKRLFKQSPKRSIRVPKTQARIQDKFDLKVELLLERLKAELSELRRGHTSVEDADFQKQLLVTIGANTREISKIVVELYHSRRMLALDRLTNTSCR